MADELVKQIDAIDKKVDGLKEKAEKVETVQAKVTEVDTVAKAAKLTADEAKLAAENAVKEGEKINTALKTIQDWQEKKDKSDTSNQEVINTFVASQKDGIKIKANDEPLNFGQVLNDTLTENKGEYEEFLRKGTGKLKLQMKAVADMTFAGQFSTASTVLTTVNNNIIMTPKRKVHIRELLPIRSMTGSTITYMTEGAGEGAPATVAEGALKPQFDLDLTEANTPNQYIAGWLRISRKMMDDTPGMVSYLNARLPEKLLVAEDAQLLNGTGVSPQLKGITTSGNFTAASSAATIDIEQIIGAISQLEDSYERNATAILLRPSDYMNFFLNKAAGSGEYDLPSNVTFTNGVLYVAGVPMFASTAMTVDKFIVGDFTSGAQIFVREAPSIVFSYEDGINIRENMVTVRIEERIALAVYGSNYFIYGDLGNVA